LFTYPSLVICSSVGWCYLLDKYKTRFLQILIPAIMALLLFPPTSWIIMNHPHEYVYFNPLVGGLDGAKEDYETDYWGNSLRSGAEWIAKKHLKESPDKKLVLFVDGSVMATFYYLEQYLGEKVIIDRKEIKNCDYAILISRHRVKNKAYPGKWPPLGTVHEIRAGETTLCAVVKNPLTINNISILPTYNDCYVGMQ